MKNGACDSLHAGVNNQGWESIGYAMSMAITDRSGIALIEEHFHDISGDKMLRNFGKSMTKHGVMATHSLRIVSSIAD